MRARKMLSLVAIIAVLGLALSSSSSSSFSSSFITPALAAPTLSGPVSCFIVGQSQLQCLADISGLGGATTATATLTATATVTTGCITPSGTNQPQSLQRITTTVIDTQTVPVQGGRTIVGLITQPLNAAELTLCPSPNMIPTIVCVTFSNILISVIPNSGPSRTFPVSGTASNCPIFS